MAVALDILGQELSANGTRRHHAVVAVVSAPFGKVVGDVKGGWRWGRVLIVDELHL